MGPDGGGSTAARGTTSCRSARWSPGASAAMARRHRTRNVDRLSVDVTNGTVVPAAAPLVMTRSRTEEIAGRCVRQGDRVAVGRRRRRPSPRTGPGRRGPTTSGRPPRSPARSRSRRRTSGRWPRRGSHHPERSAVEGGVLPPTARREPERRRPRRRSARCSSVRPAYGSPLPPGSSASAIAGSRSPSTRSPSITAPW